MKGTLTGEVLTGTISGAQRLSGTAIPRGNDGISPTIELEAIEGGTRVTITDINGTKYFDVLGGVSSEKIEELIREHLENNPPEIEESDPTVPAWAKQPNKPSYTAAEVGAVSADSLQTAINAALAQAKASGQFDGKDGATGAKGEKGDKGDTGATGAAGRDGKDGEDGEDGITPEFSIGSVTTLSAGSNAIATITGTKEKPVLNLGIPKGADGAGGGGAGGAARVADINLLAANWVATTTANKYSQVVAIDGVTENSQVDLTPSADQLVIFYEKDLALVAENEGGTVTVYAIGQKPENDYTMQVTITEVNA